MTFKLSILLIPYILFIIAWFIFCIVAVYHMMKFGFKNFTTFITTFIFISVAIIMLYASFNYINKIDWQTEVTILKNAFDINPTFNYK